MCAKRRSVSSFGVRYRDPMLSADLAGTIVHLQRLLDEIYMRDELRKRDQLFVAGVAEDVPIHLPIPSGFCQRMLDDEPLHAYIAHHVGMARYYSHLAFLYLLCLPSP